MFGGRDHDFLAEWIHRFFEHQQEVAGIEGIGFVERLDVLCSQNP